MMGGASQTRYGPGVHGGFFESYFLRANHPELPYAFWFRYTLTKPRSKESRLVGEIAGVFFDGVSGGHTVVKKTMPEEKIQFVPGDFNITLEDAVLNATHTRGEIRLKEKEIKWELSIEGQVKPVFLLPEAWYEKAFPRAKSLVILPMARFDGHVSVNGNRFSIQGWKGSVNHNWGTKYTDEYAWGQVAGFDTHTDSFLEVATACLKFGPWRTPKVTPLIFRHRGEEFAFNSFFHLCDSRGAFSDYVWVFRAETRGILIEGTISAPRDLFVGLIYKNPAKGVKYSLNTQIAACELKFEDVRKGSRRRETLFTRHRAAFEIVSDGRDLSIPISDEDNYL
ncbi:MAG: hypothetical protein N2572_00260 [Syntrophales bacterium]|nr:hypothetical protein [Syntrophales bacterium]